jgi:uncharacterized protein YjdB
LRAAALTACSVLLLLPGCSDSAGPPVATSINISQTSVSLTAIGETVQLTATVRDQGGASMQGAAVSWRSSNDAVATVSSSGMVTAVANGTATITASSGTATGSAAVSVEQRPASVRVTPGTVTLPALRDTVSLRADVLDAKGNAVTGATVQWSTSNAAVATVTPAGVVTAAGNGSAVITATAGSVNGAAQVSVQQTPHALRVSPGAVTITALTDTVRLTATVVDAREQPIAAAQVTWSSSNTGVASVAGGVVTAVSNGTTTIVATSGPLTATTAVTVRQVPAAIALSRNNVSFTNIGDTLRVSGIVRDARGHAIAGATPTWSTGNTAIATVTADGLVRAAGNGSTTLTGRAGDIAENAFVRVDNPLQLLIRHELVYEFTDNTRVPPYEYAGVQYPGGLVSYFAQGFAVHDLWRDGRPDVFVPLMKGYATGIDTRFRPFFFRNVDGRLQFATVNMPAIPGVRRIAALGRQNDPFGGLFAVQHDTHDKRMGDALLIAAGAAPFDATNRIAPLPLAATMGRNTAVNAHSMAGGDLDGDGRTDFVVGDWGNYPSCLTCGPYFLRQQPDGRWLVDQDSVLRAITFDQPMINPGAGEGHNLLIDLHLADVTGNGLADLIAGYGHGSTSSWVYYNQGGGRFSRAASRALPTPPFGVNNSMHLKTFDLDINRDGAQDLVIIFSRFVPYYGGYAFQILINDGRGGFRDESFSRMRSIPENEAPVRRLSWSDNFQFIDVNGDGQPDLIGAHGGGDGWPGRVRVWLNSGGFFNEIPVRYDLPHLQMPLGFADFAGNGRIGALGIFTSWVDAHGSAVRVWFSQLEFDRAVR